MLSRYIPLSKADVYSSDAIIGLSDLIYAIIYGRTVSRDLG